MKYRAFAVGVSISWLAGYAMAADNHGVLQKKLGIPPSVGTVVDADVASGLPEYILIQDIHRHPEAQANIAALLLYAYYHWNVTAAYLEGAYAGQTVPPGSSDQPLRTQLSEGLLSGAEMASAMAKAGHLQLKGLEDSAIYKEHVQAYQSAQSQQPRALQEIKMVRLLQQTWDLDERRFSDEQLIRLELLARLKLKPAEYARYLMDQQTDPISPALTKILKPAERFYELANRRSAVFLEEAGKSALPGPKTLVVGGFHTAEMAKQLRASGKSFVVLAPRITHSGFDDLYTHGMQDTISALNLR